MRFDPFVVGPVVFGKDFLGRDSEVLGLLQRISKGESTIITGQPRIGTTSFLERLKDPAVQKKYISAQKTQNWSFFYVPCMGLGKSYTVAAFWRDALQDLSQNPRIPAIGDFLSVVRSSNYEPNKLRQLFELLRQNKIQLIIMFDTFELLLSNASDEFKDISFLGFLHDASKRGGLSLVISSRYQSNKLLSMTPRLPGSYLFSNTINIILKNFDANTIQKLLKRASPNFSNSEEMFIQRVSGSNPYLLQAMASTMYNRRHDIEDSEANAADTFYHGVKSHFLDIWDGLDEAEKTVSVILAVKSLSGIALGQSYNYGEIERFDVYKPELLSLQRKGLAHIVEKTTRGWLFDSDHYLVWRSEKGGAEKWAMSCEAFVWWIEDEIIKTVRDIPAHDQWLRDKRNRGVITQKQWNDIKSLASKLPASALQGAFSLAKYLWLEISKN